MQKGREILLIRQLKPSIVLLYFIMSQIKTYVLKIVSRFICQMYIFCNNAIY